MKNLKKIIVFVISFTILSCSKKEDETVILPTGENTAYYYVNGQLVIPKGYNDNGTYNKPIEFGTCTPPNNSTGIYFSTSDVMLSFYFYQGLQTTGQIVQDEGGNNTPCGYINSFSKYSIWDINQRFYTQTNSGTVTIETLSADRRKFTGTFQMTLYTSAGETVNITGGHFNINLDTL
jgi:hypothetical protein